jgi:hypothetical protein
MKKIGVLMVLAVAILSISALATYDGKGCSNRDILEMGIFETEDSVSKFPAAQNTNIALLEVGNDRALANGGGVDPIATNNLKIKMNQDSGDCECCQALGLLYPCKDCCTKVNIDQIKVGSREALAFGSGFSAATNNVEIVTDQQ